jgi:signal transduction histidine kinase
VFNQAHVLALIHPDELSFFRNATAYHIDHKTDNYQMTVRFKTGSGEWRWFQIYGRLVEEAPDGSPKRVSGILLDVHQQKTTEILLQEGEALLKAVLDAMPDTKLHIKLDGTIIAVYRSSQNEEEQTYFPQKIAGRKLQEVMPVFTAKGLLFNAAEAIKTKSLQTFEYLNVTEDVTHYFEARVNQVNEEEAIIILRDITSVKKIENDLNEQVYKHDQNVRELKKYIDSNLQLENFAYIASHDLREPLRTMRMFGQFLKKKIGNQLDKENLSYLDFIISGAKRMNELVEGILAYSRVDTDPLDKEIIITEDLIVDSIDSLSEAIEKQNAVVVIEEVPSRIYGSRIRLEQVFQNLIANGIKFSKPDLFPRIVIAGHETKTHWVFKVADNGIGIKKEFFDQIFGLFKKLHNNKDFEGAGIGLALLKRIVEQHEGEIWLESDENRGTTFLFSIRKE